VSEPPPPAFTDARILQSWEANAQPWIGAIREERIESRRLVTNDAIVEAVVSRAPRSGLDIGCGEGWLTRHLSGLGIPTIGVDAVPELIEHARSAGAGDFRVASYEEIAQGCLDVTVDVAVANFSLIGHEAVDALIRASPRLLTPGGALVIQTLHPVVASADLPYVDGWRPGSWTGIEGDFRDPAPWYFRTLTTWFALLGDAGYRVSRFLEPIHPVTKKPLSVIFVALSA
jgi:2-polyprenyl-3-methyl-5-hydroxy-6-metoxy-1,4-benzoquinol methylase